MAKKNKENKNKMNPILWFFVAIVMPIVVALTITVIILMIAGVDITGWVKNKNIPIVSSLVSDSDSDIAMNDSNKNMDKKLEAKEEEIESLKNNIADLEGTNDDLELKIVKLENQAKSNQNASSEPNEPSKKDENSEEPNEPKESVKKMANTFRKMDAKQAALIIEDLDKDMALDLLKGLSNDARGNILQEMEPKTAAKFAEKFMQSDDE